MHLIDVSGTEGRNPVDDYHKINNELKNYSEKLAKRTQIIVATKSDLIADDNENFKELEKEAKKDNRKIFKISSVTGEGLNELMSYISKILKTIPKRKLD